MKIFVILYGVTVALVCGYAGILYGERDAFGQMRNVMCSNPEAESFSIRPVPGEKM
jgi:hypothetical protein